MSTRNDYLFCQFRLLTTFHNRQCTFAPMYSGLNHVTTVMNTVIAKGSIRQCPTSEKARVIIILTDDVLGRSVIFCHFY